MAATRLCAADPIDFVDAQLVAGGQHVRVFGTERGRRSDDGQLFDARRLGGHGGHQHGGRIGRSAAGYADADPAQRHVALLQVDSVRALDGYVLVQDRALELENVLSHPAHCGQQSRVGLLVRRLELRGGDCAAAQGLSVQLLAVVFDGGQAALLHVRTDRGDNFLRRQGCAKHLDRFCSPTLANHVSLRAEFSAVA